MPRKSPIGKIKDAAFGTIKDPVGTAGKAAGRAVGQARDSVALGRTVAGHVSRGAYGLVRSRLGIPDQAPSGGAAPVAVPGQPPAPSGRAVPAEEPLKDQGDALATPPATKRPAKTATAPSAKKAATKKAAQKTTPQTTQKTSQKPAKKTAKKAAPEVTATPADVAEKVAKKPPAKKNAATAAAKKAPAKKTTAKTAPKSSSPSDKLPAKKSPAKKSAAKTASKKAPAKKTPLSAEEFAAGAGTETITPVGTRGADVSTNPDTTETDLQQPGTEPLMDPATTKAVASETETLGRASDPDKS